MYPDAKETSICVNLQLYNNRWMELYRDNTLQIIDKGIVALKEVSEKVSSSKGERKKDLLNDLEWNALTVTRTLPQALALTPGKITELPFKPAPILARATAQYVVHFDLQAKNAIFRGCQLGMKILVQEVQSLCLTEQDKGYNHWAMTRLIRHLIYAANFWDEATFARFLVK